MLMTEAPTLSMCRHTNKGNPLTITELRLTNLTHTDPGTEVIDTLGYNSAFAKM